MIDILINALFIALLTMVAVCGLLLANIVYFYCAHWAGWTIAACIILIAIKFFVWFMKNR